MHADQRLVLEKARRTAAGTLDFSLLLDGLVAEREQGITIDVAWRYFDTAARRLVIIDAPGHEQYTRNMATGASHADVAILLVDARSGVKVQTRRHAAILDLMGVARVVLAVNKMDLADWSEARFRAIERDFLALAGGSAFTEAVAIPVSAVLGDNVAHRSAVDALVRRARRCSSISNGTPRAERSTAGEFRFPVQTVIRAGQDFRGLAGTVTSGAIERGGEVVDALERPARQGAAHRDHGPRPGQRQRRPGGRAPARHRSRRVARRRACRAPHVRRRPCAASMRGWCGSPTSPSARERGYLLRTATDLVPVASLEIAAHLDLDALTERPAATCAANDIAVARIAPGTRVRSSSAMPSERDTGSFVLVDAVTGATVAGGIVAQTHARGERAARGGLPADAVAPEAGDRCGPGRRHGLRAGAAPPRRRGGDPAARGRRGRRDRGSAGRRPGSMPRAVWLGLLAALSFAFAAAIVFGIV